MSSEKQPDAIDLSHHLSAVSKNRVFSPIRRLQRDLKPGMIPMATGSPSPDYFPFAALSADVLFPNAFPLNTSSSSSVSWFWKLFGANTGANRKKEKTEVVTIQKWPAQPGDLSLAELLQYGSATGDPHLAAVVHEFTAKVYQPAYKNWRTVPSCGNTDGFGRVAFTLLNPGDGVLAAEWTYPTMLAASKPWNINPVPISMDGQGMRADALRHTLANWDEAAHGGMKRPHVMYLIPVGQNPTGSTMQYERKKEIYDVCVEFDVIIIEDDPYYFLQQGEYVPKDARVEDGDGDEETFIASLSPSFLKLDYQGRVIRLDTFSKTLAPGARLGWFTCNPMFAERLERAGETSTHAPCGFGQAMITSLLLKWRYEGYVRWLRALAQQYKHRRDFFLDSLSEEFDLTIGTGVETSVNGYREGSAVWYASLKKESSGLRAFSDKASAQDTRAVFSFVPPSAGMFVWIKLHLEDFITKPEPISPAGIKQLEMDLWLKLADEGVLFSPGVYFHAVDVTDEEHGDGHFRVAFSIATEEQMKTASTTFGAVIREFVKDL